MAYIGNDLQVAFPSYRIIDDISSGFNGSQTTFALTVGGATPVPFPINPQQCLISVNGVIQKPDPTGASGFNLVGSNIVFASAPTGGWSFFGVILAGADYVNVGANFPSGSAGAPSITFDSDTDTGIYNSGANQVSISTAGVERFRVDSAGQLEAVSLGSAASPTFSFTTDTNTGIYSPGADQVAISTNGSGRLFVTSAGLVGIGTSAPGDVLHVKGSSTYAGVIADNSAATGGGAFRAYRNGVQKAIFCVDSWVTGTSSDDAAIYADAGGGIKFYTNNSSTAKAVLTSGGSLGIGTTVPSKAFVVSSSGAQGIELSPNDAGGGTNRIISYNRNTSAYTDLLIEGLSLQFQTNNGNERFRCDSSGRLLVGLSSGSDNNALLKVQGNVGGSTGSGWIDIRRGLSTPGSGSQLGILSFSDSSGNNYASIDCYTDAATGTNDYPGRLVFSTTADGASSPTERMRLSNDGVLRRFGSGSAVTNVFATNAAAGTTVQVITARYSATDVSSGTDSFYVYSNGNVLNTNNSYAGISDLKLKENIVDANSQWSDIKSLQIRKYNFKEGQTHTQIGLIAQEVELVSPGLVSESPDRDAEGNDLGTVTKSVNYSVLYMKAVKALQEAMLRIEDLEARLDSANL